MVRSYHRKTSARGGRARLLRILFCILASGGCGSPDTTSPEEVSEFTWPEESQREQAVIDVRGFGPIHLDLYPELAPKTVANFKKLAGEAFYDGTTFHRVIPGFMIQAGDPLSRDNNPHNDGRGGPGYTLPDEFTRAPMKRGVVAMANKGRPNSGGSQFFILQRDRPGLQGRYSVFGRVADADLTKIDEIAGVQRDIGGRWGTPDRPIEDVVIQSTRIQTP